jgi:tetratricopeptide (TPR) repeat protein
MTNETKMTTNGDAEGEHLDLGVLRSFGAGALGWWRGFEVAVHLFSCEACRSLLETLGAERLGVEAAFRTFFPGGGLSGPAAVPALPPGVRAAPERTGNPDEETPEADQEEEEDDDEYAGMFEEVLRDLAPRLERLARERREAPGRWSELEADAPTRWEWRVRNEARFQSYGLAEHLVEECRRLWSDDPVRAQTLAELAVTVIGTLDPKEHLAVALSDLEAEAWGCVANCLRIRSDVRRVEEIFELAEELRLQGGGDPLEEAMLLDLRGSYLIDQRRFKAAEKVLRRAIRLFGKAGDRHREGRTTMKFARLYREKGETAEAIRTLERARSLVDPHQEPRSRLLVEQNLAVYLREAGRLAEAERAVEMAHELAEASGSRLDRLRVRWTEGLLRHEARHLAPAVAALQAVRAGFVSEGLAYDAALVSLDLAAIVLDAGDRTQARRLAHEIVPLFTARGIHREAAAALAVLQRALQADTADAVLVADVAAYLHRARENPVLRFRRRS